MAIEEMAMAWRQSDAVSERGHFPRQIKISERCARGRKSAMREWMKNPMFYDVNDEG
jgi:hypothetical protein